MSYEIDDGQYPATAVVYIESTWGALTLTGSGIIVGKNDVLTAAHVVYNGLLGGRAETIKIYPSFDPREPNNTSYDPINYDYFTSFDPDLDGRLLVGDFRSQTLGGSEIDIALLSTSVALGDQYGWIPIDWEYPGGDVKVIGYPSIYNRNPTKDDGKVTHSPIDGVFYIDSTLEVNPGNSGSPIYYDYGQGPYLVALVSTAVAAPSIGAHRYWLEHAMIENDALIASLPLTDAIVGTHLDDDLSGTESSDVIYGGAGNDRIYGGRGDDHIDGGPGLDHVIYSGLRSRFDLEILSVETKIVRDTFAVFEQGSDTLTNIERLIFSDINVAFDIDGSAGKSYRLYQAAFDRLPDQVGLGYWISEIDKGKGDLAWMAENFILSDEFRQLYGTPDSVSAEQFLTLLYANVFNRAPDALGFDYWMVELNSGFPRGRVLASFSESAEYQTNVIGVIQNGISYIEWDG